METNQIVEAAKQAGAEQLLTRANELRGGYSRYGRSVLAAAAVKLTLMAEQLASPDAPAWMIDFAMVDLKRDLHLVA